MLPYRMTPQDTAGQHRTTAGHHRTLRKQQERNRKVTFLNSVFLTVRCQKLQVLKCSLLALTQAHDRFPTRLLSCQ